MSTSSTPKNSFLGMVLVGAGLSSAYYPIVRIQTMMQTQLGYSSLNTDLKLNGIIQNTTQAFNNSFGGLFRGVSFYASYSALKAAIFFTYSKSLSGSYNSYDKLLGAYIHCNIATLIGAGLSYPFELLQVKAASGINSTNPSQVLNYGESVGAFTNPSSWKGFSLLYLRYLTLNSALYLHFTGFNLLYPWLLGFCAIPIDVVRRNYMMSQWEKGLPYKSIMETSQFLVQNHGYKSLFRGFITYPELYLFYFLISNNQRV